MAMSLPSRNADRRVLSEINVTPLVDVMLVLLVIFMVTAPMLQRGTDVQLPSGAALRRQGAGPTHAHPQQGRADLLEQPRGADGPRCATDLMAAMQGRERTLQFRGDAQVSYGLVIEIMDTLKAAGIETVGMITERPAQATTPVRSRPPRRSR